MRTQKTKFYNEARYFELYEQMLASMQGGKHNRTDGQRISKGTLKNYTALLNHMRAFAQTKKIELRLYNDIEITLRERAAANNYHARLYKHFTKYLYGKGMYDNYIGLLIRLWRAFYNYLNKDLHMYVGNYHLQFFVPKDEIPVVALSKHQLFALMHDPEIDQKIKEYKLQDIRDIFVFGCTVALRYSDLKQLTKRHLQKKNDHYYLDVRASKTQIETRMRLPSYCTAIIEQHALKSPYLLPQITLQHFNRRLKELANLLPENIHLDKVRERKGKIIVRQKDAKTKRKLKLSDHVSSHTMRRTAISIMLESGMDEMLVRRISGHAPNSKEFYRYVRLAQHRLDAETTRVFSFEDMKG